MKPFEEALKESEALIKNYKEMTWTSFLAELKTSGIPLTTSSIQLFKEIYDVGFNNGTIFVSNYFLMEIMKYKSINQPLNKDIPTTESGTSKSPDPGLDKKNVDALNNLINTLKKNKNSPDKN